MGYKESMVYSVFKAKCPVCHEGDVFTSNKVYNIKEFDKMHDKCSVCGHKYEIENGFFYGAMYVSYAMTVAFSVATFLLTYWFWPNAEYYNYIINIILVVVLLAPITYRGSRLLWMKIFTKYNPDYKKKNSGKLVGE